MLSLLSLRAKCVTRAPFMLQAEAGFKLKLTRETGHSVNTHRSNRAKLGLFHGKEVRTGNSFSHSHSRTKRSWKPNVQNKRLWSDSLDQWVKLKITTAGMRAVDNHGGLDNYLMCLDEMLVIESPYINKVRDSVAAALYHAGELNEKQIRYFYFDVCPPEDPKNSGQSIDEILASLSAQEEGKSA